jgi:hypothetical protein
MHLIGLPIVHEIVDEKVHVHEMGQIDLYKSKKIHQIEIVEK